MPHRNAYGQVTRTVLVYAFDVVASQFAFFISLNEIFVAAELTNLKIRVFVRADNQVTGGQIIVDARFV